MSCEQMILELQEMDSASLFDLLVSLYEKHTGVFGYPAEYYHVHTSCSCIALEANTGTSSITEPWQALFIVYPTCVLVTNKTIAASDGYDLLNQALRQKKVKKLLE